MQTLVDAYCGAVAAAENDDGAVCRRRGHASLRRDRVYSSSPAGALGAGAGEDGSDRFFADPE